MFTAVTLFLALGLASLAEAPEGGEREQVSARSVLLSSGSFEATFQVTGDDRPEGFWTWGYPDFLEQQKGSSAAIRVVVIHTTGSWTLILSPLADCADREQTIFLTGKVDSAAVLAAHERTPGARSRSRSRLPSGKGP